MSKKASLVRINVQTSERKGRTKLILISRKLLLKMEAPTQIPEAGRCQVHLRGPPPPSVVQ